MIKEDPIQLGQEALYLAACALHSVVPDKERVNAMNLEKLYAFCQFHALTAMICMVLEPTDAFAAAAPELKKKWQDAKNKAIRKNMLLDAERTRLFAWMESAGIWHMPLKGILLKELYPKIGMRQMSDNDILYDAAFQQAIKRYMTAQGYTGSVGKNHHDTYKKPPVYNFELHTALYGRSHNPVLQAYYQNIKEKLLSDSDSAFGYHFRDEDFYIYLTSHAWKHYSSAGTGLRTLTDVYVYLRKKGTSLDWTYIDGELKKLGIADFERGCRTLAEKLLSKPVYFHVASLCEEEETMLAFFSGSGTYGTLQNRVEKELRELASKGKAITTMDKLRYLRSRLFPNLAWFNANVPFCYQHKWSIPFFYIYRCARVVLLHGNRLKNELHTVKAIGESDTDSIPSGKDIIP